MLWKIMMPASGHLTFVCQNTSMGVDSLWIFLPKSACSRCSERGVRTRQAYSDTSQNNCTTCNLQSVWTVFVANSPHGISFNTFVHCFLSSCDILIFQCHMAKTYTLHEEIFPFLFAFYFFFFLIGPSSPLLDTPNYFFFSKR